MHKSSCCSTLLPTLVICCLFDNNHSDRCGVISHCDFACISLIMSDGEHLSPCLLAICISLGKCLERSYGYFSIKLLIFLVLSISFANIFPHSVGCLFVFLTVSHIVQCSPICLILIWFHCLSR